jgi:ketosteroid isomerase-like protein
MAAGRCQPMILPRFRPGRRPACLSRGRALLPFLAAALLGTAAHADEAAEVSKLMRAGQHAEALKRADVYLARVPRDAQVRFYKGVLLSESRPAEAIAIFTALTEDFPRLPEPYNNLAVLYAASGQYEKARAALDKSIRTNPAYATVYENLGDIHARLASQAYEKALQVDAGTAPTAKLTLMQSLAGSAGLADMQLVAPPLLPVAQPGPKEPEVAAVRLPADARSVAPSVPSVPGVPGVAIGPVSASLPEKAAEKTSNSRTGTAREAGVERSAVMAVVSAWAKSWSERDVPAYLAHYASEFEPPKGMSRKAWAEERHARISGKGRIEVRIEKPQVDVNGNSAKVRFRQIYRSDRLSASGRKTLLLERRSGKWQIMRESAG